MSCHILFILFMRQLPPATGKAPFVVEPRVRDFDFRVLRQNRRVVQDETRRDEIELFHEVLTDISMCQETQSVRDFIIAAYVRGASIGSADHTPLEGNTAVFTKRRLQCESTPFASDPSLRCTPKHNSNTCQLSRCALVHFFCCTSSQHS